MITSPDVSPNPLNPVNCDFIAIRPTINGRCLQPTSSSLGRVAYTWPRKIMVGYRDLESKLLSHF